MRIKNIVILVALISNVSSVSAQDTGAPDSIKLVALTTLTTGLSTQSFEVACSAFVDSNILDVLQIGWDWTTNSATLQMDSAVASATFDNFTLVSFFLDNDIATTNDSQVAIALGINAPFGHFPNSPSWQHVCTYYMTMTNWTASSSLIIDTTQLGIAVTEYLFLPDGGVQYVPIWGGPINISATAVEESITDILPTALELEQNYPNPFNPSTTIEFSLPTRNHVALKVFNITGEEVAVLLNKTLSVGSYRVNWDGRDYEGNEVASGVYFYKLSAGNFSKSKKMLLLK